MCVATTTYWEGDPLLDFQTTSGRDDSIQKHSPTKIAKKGSSVCTIPIDFAERESCLAACSSVCGPVGDLAEWKSLFEMLSESTAEQQGKWWLLHVVAVCVPRCECFGSLRDGCGWEGF